MDRRHLLASVAGVALAAPQVVRAQFLGSRPVVGIIRGGAWVPSNLRDFMIYGLRENGLEEGRDFDVVYRTTDGDPTRAPALVAELVALNPAVIVAQTTELVVQLHQATKTIPIVASTVTDPIGLGLIESLAHPGGNVTGLLSVSADTGKYFEVLQQIVPGLTKVGLLLNPTNRAHTAPGPNSRTDAQATTLGITVVRAWAKVAGEIEAAVKSLADQAVGAFLVAQDALFQQEGARIAALAIAARLPSHAMGLRTMVEAGCLISYGGSPTDRWRHLGWYVSKILKGEKPGELPVEQQEKLELVINMRTAKVLGLTIPPLVLTRADDLIE